jgi:hypothetical protein
MITRARVLRAVLAVGTLASLFISYWYFDLGLPLVAERSSNPDPSEAARVIGPGLMDHGTKWLCVAIGCLVILVATFFITPRSKIRGAGRSGGP